MILAVLAYADALIGNEPTPPPPNELALYWQMTTYHALPYSGGLLDQPAGLLRRVNAAGNIYNSYREWYVAPSRSEWQARNPERFAVVVAAWKLRKQYGD